MRVFSWKFESSSGHHKKATLYGWFFYGDLNKVLELPRGSLTRRRAIRGYRGEALAERRRSGRGFACKPQVSLLQGTIQKKSSQRSLFLYGETFCYLARAATATDAKVIKRLTETKLLSLFQAKPTK